MIAALLALAATGAWAERAPYSPERLAFVRAVNEVRLSPDGRDVSFISDISGQLEVWMMPVRGGWPLQLSTLEEQVGDLRYSPDGKTLVFASDYGGDERTDIFMVPANGGEVEKVTVSTQAEGSPRFSPDGKRLAYLADPVQEFQFQLFAMDLSSRVPVQLTHETVTVKFPVWAPDGKTIAVVRTGDDQKGELLLVDAAGSTDLRVINPPVSGGITIPQEFSADGRELLCLSRNEKGFMQLFLVDVGAGRGRFIGQDEWDVDEAYYHPTEGIFYSRNEGGASALYHLPFADAKPVQLQAARGRIEHFDLDRAGDKLAYTWSDSRHAPDVYVMDLRSGFTAPLTRSMAPGIKPASLSEAKLIKYPSFDGRMVTALYLPPVKKRLGDPPPAVIEVHGGPDWQTFDDFSPMRQALAEAGFAVLSPNFRGSTGYGRQWLELNRKDWGGADRRDLLEGVKYLAKRGELDPKRVGITGESYGGFMTLYALARNDGTWAAGVERFGMPDLIMDYESSKDRFGDWYATQMGTPTGDAKLFKERSAINYLEDLKAPLLIFQGERDTNVPKEEGELIYKKLKEKGRDVVYVAYPDEGHGFTKRHNRVDFNKKLLEFFKKKLAPR